MISQDYPVQRTNPARDLYNFWYGVVRYSSSHSLIRQETPDRHNPCAYTFDHRGLYVDPCLCVDPDHWLNGKPVLFLQDVIRIWPNGHFQPQMSIRKGRYWAPELRIYEKHTFLQWSWAANSKVVTVQDSPRQHNNVPNRWLNEKDTERRRPYLTLDSAPLLDNNMLYRLKGISNGDWMIEPVRALHARWSNKAARALVRDTREALRVNYQIASDRYDRWARRAELAAIREGEAKKPARPISALERVNVERQMREHMTVYEPKVGPGGKPLSRQLSLLTPLEVVTNGR